MTGGSVQRAVSVLSLGGTIAMTNAGRDGAGVVPTLDVAALLTAIPDKPDCQITARNLRTVPGASLQFDDLCELIHVVRDELDSGADGVVITQGTDTIEETAYLLDLTVARAAPVVVTGALRNPTLAGADGPANLLAAVQAAASDQLRGVGCVVVMSDEIHAARHVHKMHSTSPGAFVSPDTGPIGRVVEGQPRLFMRPLAAPTYPVPTRTVRIALVTACFGDDGELLRRLGTGFDGVVIAGFGVGHVPAAFVAPLAELVSRVPVVLASRTGGGPVLRATYGFPGSERDLQDRGLINAGFLGPFKARILLYVLTAAGAGHQDIVAAFDAAGGRTD
ncbi:MAG TPA: asparaginase [Pseudonocardiaceae bacterium]|nr:asparaginase [Pseudonocardiaceae bacterium]